MNDGDLLFKSGVQWKTLSPKWDETFYFPIGLSDNPKLLLSCFDTDETVRFRDDFIGSFELPVSKFLDFKKHDDCNFHFSSLFFSIHFIIFFVSNFAKKKGMD